jgi:hypothetical protein
VLYAESVFVCKVSDGPTIKTHEEQRLYLKTLRILRYQQAGLSAFVKGSDARCRSRTRGWQICPAPFLAANFRHALR